MFLQVRGVDFIACQIVYEKRTSLFSVLFFLNFFTKNNFFLLNPSAQSNFSGCCLSSACCFSLVFMSLSPLLCHVPGFFPHILTLGNDASQLFFTHTRRNSSLLCECDDVCQCVCMLLLADMKMCGKNDLNDD